MKPLAEQMITLGRRGDLHARRQATAFLRSRDVVHHLFAEIAPRFKDRPGGYTRIIRLGPRPGDAAEMVYLELVEDEYAPKGRAARRPATAAAEPGGGCCRGAEAEADEAEAEEPTPTSLRPMRAEADEADAEERTSRSRSRS